MMLKILILRLMARSLRVFFWSLTPGKQLVFTKICGRLLKLRASQLSVVFSQLFMWSLKENTVPFTWKTSVICHVPKKLKRNPSSLNGYRLIALTSVVMKCFEHISLHQPMKHIKPHTSLHTSTTKALKMQHSLFCIMHIIYILTLKIQVHSFKFASLTFLLPSNVVV